MEDTIKEKLFEDIYNEDKRKEFFHVKPLDETENLCLLDPKLPPSTQLIGRGTLVDIQLLHSQLHTVRLLRRLLNRKFSNREPDCGEDIAACGGVQLVQGQVYPVLG